MTQWQLMPGIDPAAAACFADLDKVFTLEGDIVARDAMSNVVRVAVNSRHYYVKRYAGLGDKPLRRWLVTPRIQLEWENLQRFAAWGIPTADLVAYGLEKKQGRFFRGAMITAEIPDTQDLRRLARNADPRLKSRRWWDGVSRQLADITRRMHAQRFAHGDLKWRNLLVDKEDRLFLIDCPSGGFWRPPFLEYRIVKDLACLDKSAKRNLSRSRRLRFYLDYVGKRRLDKRDKQRIRKIVGFFVGRDEDLASAASLRAAGRTPLPRQSIALESGALLTLKRWLRVLPGKRLTGVGEWQGRPVLAKLFIAARGAERHWQRECRGVEVLQTSALPSPALLLSGKLEGAVISSCSSFSTMPACPIPAHAMSWRWFSPRWGGCIHSDSSNKMRTWAISCCRMTVCWSLTARLSGRALWTKHVPTISPCCWPSYRLIGKPSCVAT